jgi:hypothetical protein
LEEIEFLNNEKNGKKRKKTKNFGENMWKSGMPIVVGAGSHARPIRRSLKTERNWDKIFGEAVF